MTNSQIKAAMYSGYKEYQTKWLDSAQVLGENHHQVFTYRVFANEYKRMWRLYGGN
jgi:hypothetical protein